MKTIHLLSAFILSLILAQVGCEEKNYTSIVNQLQASIQNQTGLFYHSAYERLAYISDTYGPRLWGSEALESVILEMYKMAKEEGFDDVHLEAVKNFTKWVRGDE